MGLLEDIDAQNRQNYAKFGTNLPPTAQPVQPAKKKGRGGFATSLISEAGGLGGALGGAAIGSAILPGIGTVIGGALGGFLGGTGGAALEQQVRDDEIRIGEALGEGAFSGVFGGLGAVGQAAKIAKAAGGAATAAKGATTAAKTVGATAKAGRATAAVQRGNLLQRIGQSQTQSVVAPKVQPSPFAALDQQQIVGVMQNVPGLSAKAKLNNLPGYFNNLSGQIDDIIKASTKTTPKTSIYSKIRANAADLPQFVGTDKAYQNALKVELQNLGTQLGKGPVNASTIFQTKQALSSKMTNVFSKVERGLDLNAKEASRLAIWGSLDDAVTRLAPRSKELLGVQSTLYKAAPGVLKASEKTFGVPLLGIQSRTAEQGLQAGRGLVGRTATALGGAQARTIGKLPPIAKVMLPAQAGLSVGTALTQPPEAQPTTLEDTMTQMYGGGLDTGMVGAEQLGGLETQRAFSPYGKENLLYDISRDPANASNYIKYYQTISTIFGEQAAPKLTATQQKSAASAINALQDIPMIEQAIESGQIGGARMIPGSQTPIGRRILGTENLDAALFNIADNILRARTGAAAPEAEIRRFMESFLPNAFDSPEAQRRKLQRAVRELQGFVNPAEASAGTLEEYLLQQQGGGY